MDNKTFYANPSTNYWPYNYPAATVPVTRPEPLGYMMPQTAIPAGLKGRPVSSVEEARVAQIDLDGSMFFFPDFGNNKIYTKRINPDGTASFGIYSLDTPVAPNPVPEYATKAEVDEMRKMIEDAIAKFMSKPTAPAPKISF